MMRVDIETILQRAAESLREVCPDDRQRAIDSIAASLLALAKMERQKVNAAAMGGLVAWADRLMPMVYGSPAGKAELSATGVIVEPIAKWRFEGSHKERDSQFLENCCHIAEALRPLREAGWTTQIIHSNLGLWPCDPVQGRNHERSLTMGDGSCRWCGVRMP